MKSHSEKFEKVRPAQLRHARSVLTEVLLARRPADELLQTLFRAHREMGSRDRAGVSALVYGALRDLRRLERIAGARDADALCTLVAFGHGVALDVAAAAGVADAPQIAQRLAAFDPATLSDAERLNVPDASWARWCGQYDADGARALAQALGQEAPVDLRVNMLRATRDQALAALGGEGIAATPTRRSPLGLRLERRVALQNTRAFRDGWVEPQDEGSQLIALLAGARPDETVIDWCAGAGGKALAIAAQMRDRGTLIACDTQRGRLQRMGERLARAGVSCVRTRVLADDAAPPGPADAVLVDAPCSASGTWRRNPELRLQEPDLAQLAALQGAILACAAQAVRAGGRLVYATCSLYAEENEQVVDAFLAAHADFERADAGAILRAQGADWDEPLLRLLPQVHGTDGFFAAALRRLG